jgi:EAL domain-containing protein (putative c-di-GMP-specific phosphodiesterase class I)
MVDFMSSQGNKPLPEHLARYTHPEMLAYIDWHLGLPNGLKLENDIRASGPNSSLIVLDAFSLREINEIFNRDMGDKLLEAIRDFILSLDIPYSNLYHIGGGKFCAVTQTDHVSLIRLARTISNRFRKTWKLATGENKLNVLCDHVVCVFPSSFTDEGETLIVKVERTVKKARINDTGKIVVFNEDMDKEFKQRRRFEFSIKRCVANDMEGFDVFYQAIADPVNGVWCGLEALCRWNSPELGPVPPNIFIPETERLDLIGTIGLWVLETAVSHCKKWGLDKHRKFILDVNVSANQFADVLLADKVIQILRDYDYPGEKLCLEITESNEFTFNGLSLNTIERIKAEKVLFALDDFGTGYSAFNKLKQMPVDIVKVERIFVAGIEKDSYLRYLFRAMAELAHVSKMKLIAEGVECTEQMDILLKSGADYLQGYLFSKPLPPRELEQMLSHFHVVDESFNMIRKQKIDLSELFQMDSDYAFSPELHRLMNQCTHILLRHKEIDRALDEIIALIGEHMDISRAYVFQRGGESLYTNTHEWCAEGVKPRMDSLAPVRILKSWTECLSRDGIILSSDIDGLPEDIIAFLEPQNVKSIAVIPLWDGDVLIGYIGFDDCLHYRDWRAEEVLMLHNFCTIVASVMNKIRAQRENQKHMNVLSDVLHHSNMVVYVSEVSSGKILFANDYTKFILGADPTGTYRHEHNDDVYKNRFVFYDTPIPWTNGDTVRLEYAVQIPEG